MSVEQVQHLLYYESGLKGSGVSNDVRLLAAALGGLGAFVFIAGIGDNSPSMRAAIVQRLAWLGGVLDPATNATGRTSIAATESRIGILVVPTDEELSDDRTAHAGAAITLAS